MKLKVLPLLPLQAPGNGFTGIGSLRDLQSTGPCTSLGSTLLLPLQGPDDSFYRQNFHARPAKALDLAHF